MLDDVPVWYELWRQINGFPPNYVGNAQALASEGKGDAGKSKADKGGKADKSSSGYGDE